MLGLRDFSHHLRALLTQIDSCALTEKLPGALVLLCLIHFRSDKRRALPMKSMLKSRMHFVLDSSILGEPRDGQNSKILLFLELRVVSYEPTRLRPVFNKQAMAYVYFSFSKTPKKIKENKKPKAYCINLDQESSTRTR
uniref:Thioredoxin II n=1 Tax=Rhizophora mucronata TaxID=61149 RepID=A0A2P2IYX2_RHIMU